MNLTPKQSLLFDFVKSQHGDQKRKYTDEPYWTHLLSVAELVSKYEKRNLAIEIALCHDLFEDTNCEYAQLVRKLLEIGYLEQEAEIICMSAVELTDFFTHKDSPTMNRQIRKVMESKRLGRISTLAQSVKYADLIDNCVSIVDRDPEFAVTYLQEKLNILDNMRNGNINLLILACYVYKSSVKKIEFLG
jgi:(p)ppGpp synthase/HD superfamily hydrolase